MNRIGFAGPAYALLGFGYGVTDRPTLSLDVTNRYLEWEFNADWLVLGQEKESGLPLDVTLRLGGSVVTPSQPAEDLCSGRFRLNTALSLDYQVSNSGLFPSMTLPVLIGNSRAVQILVGHGLEIVFRR